MTIDKFYKTSIVLLLLLTIIFSPGLILALDNQAVEFSIFVELTEATDLKISREVKDILQEEDLVEILVMLKEQADTGKVADIAKRSLPLSATPDQRKILSRYAVINALQQTAEKTQTPILDRLKTGQTMGEVEEFKSFYIVNIIYARVSADLVYELAKRPEVYKILPNSKIELIEPLDVINTELLGSQTVEWNIDRIGAPAVWHNYGINGAGVVVGIIDTGVFWEHEALKEKWRGFNPADPDNPDPVYNWFDAVNSDYLPHDINGHGTHVTGIILGADPLGDNQIGVAPGTQWIAARAFDGNSSNAEWLLKAGQYMLAPEDENGNPNPAMAPDIINNSWGGGTNEWYRHMVQAWRNAGILPVFSTGNNGPGSGTVVEPARYPEGVAVAATSFDDSLAIFSSRGPAPYNTPDDLKPDISAPGVDIRSSVHNGSYKNASGTSMAAPHISGAAALLLSADPSICVDQLEAHIIDSAEPLMDDYYLESPNYGYGHGLVNALGALFLLNEDYGNITGQVLGEGENGEVLRAVVKVLETGRKVRTDQADGKFNLFHPAGQNWTLQLESDGYHTRQLSFNLGSEESLDLGQIYLEAKLPEPTSRRLSGADRYQTAIAISQDSYPEPKSADAVVIVRSDEFADGLTGSVLAYKENGPVLLTGSCELASGVEAEIVRVLKDGGNIYILGGPAAISPAVESKLQNMGAYSVERIAGQNRNETAYKIAQKVGNSSGQAIIAYSHNFPDALSISSYAARHCIPILLTSTEILSPEAKRYLEENTLEKAYIVGGSSVISGQVYSEIEEVLGSGNVTRLGGADRYETARLIAAEFFQEPKVAALTCGGNFPDALSGGVNAATNNAPILLVRTDNIPMAIEHYLTDKKHSMDQVIIYGGTSMVSDAIMKEAQSLISSVY